MMTQLPLSNVSDRGDRCNLYVYISMLGDNGWQQTWDVKWAVFI